MTDILTRPAYLPLAPLPALPLRQGLSSASAYVYASEEDRCALRYRVEIPAKLRFSCSQSFLVRVSDISLAGFACDALLEIEHGTICWITLPGLGALQAETIRCDSSSMACAFSNLLAPAVLDRYVARYPAPKEAV